MTQGKRTMPLALAAQSGPTVVYKVEEKISHYKAGTWIYVIYIILCKRTQAFMVKLF